MTACVNLIPTEKGMAGGPDGVAPTGVGALAAECRGAAAVIQLSGARRVFAGTQTRLYELVGTTWTDRSRAGNYTGSTVNRWSFCQFGDATIATNDTETIGASTSGAFSDIATAPKAKVVVAGTNFVIAFNTSDGTYGDSPDRWWCCGLRDHTTWTPSVTTQATTGRLIDGSGEIVAAARLGAQVVAFKGQSMYIGTYAGAPVVWQWDRVPGELGCVGPEAVCELGAGGIAWLADDNFYVHDGTRAIPVATDQIRQWFFDNSSAEYRYRTIASFDRQKNLVWFNYPGRSSSGACDKAIAYHLLTKQWGVADRAVQAVVNFTTPGLTFDGIGGVYSTWDSLPAIPYDSQAWLGGGRVFSIFNGSNQLQNLVGTSVSSGFTTGDFGDDDQVSAISRVRLRFVTRPTTATVAGSYRNGAGDVFMSGASGSISDSSAFDIRQSGRWHRMEFGFSGPVELNGIKFDSTPAGFR